MADQMDVLKNPRQQPEQIRLLLLEVDRLRAEVAKLRDDLACCADTGWRGPRQEEGE